MKKQLLSAPESLATGTFGEPRKFNEKKKRKGKGRRGNITGNDLIIHSHLWFCDLHSGTLNEVKVKEFISHQENLCRIYRDQKKY